MLIGGLQKFTALDYPGKIAATVFTVGCNFRCPFCHNGEIVSSGSLEFPGYIAEDEVLSFLESRRGELDGVCITGGEPTLQKDLGRFISQVRALGFSIKLDTNGANFGVVEDLVRNGSVDYFAIDIKTAFDKYHMVKAPTGGKEGVIRSVEMIIGSGIPLELRTTVAPLVVEERDFDNIIAALGGAEGGILPKLYRYSVQAFRPQKCLDKEYEKLEPYDDSVLERIAEKLRKHCPRVDVIR